MKRRTNVVYETAPAVAPKYSEDIENGVVTCELKFHIPLNCFPLNTIMLNADILNRIAIKLGGYVYWDDENNCPDIVSFTARGTAKCNTDVDTYNPVIGKRIALTRAQQEAFRIGADWWVEIWKCLNEVCNNVAKMAQSNEYVRLDCKWHAKEIGGTETIIK